MKKLGIVLGSVVAALALAGSASACVDKYAYNRQYGSAIKVTVLALQFNQAQLFGQARDKAKRAYSIMYAANPCTPALKPHRRIYMAALGHIYRSAIYALRGNSTTANSEMTKAVGALKAARSVFNDVKGDVYG